MLLRFQIEKQLLITWFLPNLSLFFGLFFIWVSQIVQDSKCVQHTLGQERLFSERKLNSTTTLILGFSSFYHLWHSLHLNKFSTPLKKERKEEGDRRKLHIFSSLKYAWQFVLQLSKSIGTFISGQGLSLISIVIIVVRMMRIVQISLTTTTLKFIWFSFCIHCIWASWT